MNWYLIILKNWLGYVVMLTLMCGIVYIVGQQGFRQSANDPQYQMVQEVAHAIEKGADPGTVVKVTPVDLSATLSPYIIIYDSQGKSLINGAVLNRQPSNVPPGVITNVQKQGTTAVTWQPRPGIRQAIVATIAHLAGKSYVVVAGRSMHQVEERIAMLGKQVALGWTIAIIAMLVVASLQQLLTKSANWST